MPPAGNDCGWRWSQVGRTSGCWGTEGELRAAGSRMSTPLCCPCNPSPPNLEKHTRITNQNGPKLDSKGKERYSFKHKSWKLQSQFTVITWKRTCKTCLQNLFYVLQKKESRVSLEWHEFEQMMTEFKFLDAPFLLKQVHYCSKVWGQ